MAQERPCVGMEKKQYFDRNILDMSIDITYFVLDILKWAYLDRHIISHSTDVPNWLITSIINDLPLLNSPLNLCLLFSLLYHLDIKVICSVGDGAGINY